MDQQKVKQFFKIVSRCIAYSLLILLFATCKKEVVSEKISYSGIKYYQCGNSDKVNKVEKTTDGGFIFCGSTGSDSNRLDAFMMKVNAAGEQEWYHTYGGIYFDEFEHAIQCSDGGYIAVGTTNSIGEGIVFDNLQKEDYIVKTNSQGIMEWQKSYFVSTCSMEYVKEITKNEYLMVGQYSAGNRNIAMQKLDYTGNLKEYKYFPAQDSVPPLRDRKSWNEFANFIGTTADGSIFIGGVMDRSNRLVEVQKHITFMMKLDKSRFDSVSFFYTYPDYMREYFYWLGTNFQRVPIVKIINTNDGYYIGTYLELPGTKMVMQLLKTDLTGKLIWQKQYSGLGNAMFYDMLLHSDGSLLLAGSSTSDVMNFGFLEAFENTKAMVLKVDPNGNELWTSYVGGDENATIAKSIKANGDQFIIAGLTSLSSSGVDKMLTYKINAYGKLAL